MKKFGHVNWRFKQAIDAAGITQKELGERVKINPAFISMATNGRYLLDAAEQRRIARVLKRPAQEIFGD